MMFEPTPIGTPVPANPLLAKPAPNVSTTQTKSFRIRALWSPDPAFARGFIVGVVAIAIVAFLLMTAREGEWERKTKTNGSEVAPPVPGNRR